MLSPPPPNALSTDLQDTVGPRAWGLYPPGWPPCCLPTVSPIGDAVASWCVPMKHGHTSIHLQEWDWGLGCGRVSNLMGVTIYK